MEHDDSKGQLREAELREFQSQLKWSFCIVGFLLGGFLAFSLLSSIPETKTIAVEIAIVVASGGAGAYLLPLLAKRFFGIANLVVLAGIAWLAWPFIRLI